MELPPPGTRRVSISNPQESPQRSSIASATFPNRPSLLPAGIPKFSATSLSTSNAFRQSSVSKPRANSLLPTPILQKTPLNPPESLQGKGSNVSSVRYADEHGKTHSETDREKDRAKSKGKGKGKGTGTRLLNMLRKTLQGSQSEEMVVEQVTPNLIPFGDVVGCLAVRIKSCRQFSHRFIVQQHTNMFVRVSINHIVKCTKLRNLKTASTERNFILKFDEIKYFSVQVPRRQDDERNTIFLELMQEADPGKPSLVLGTVESHLYEVIQVICRMEVEFMFSYGTFGYGFSHQLKPLQKIIEPSMFMNIAPPPERTDPITNVITPQRVGYPAFLSPDLNVTVGVAEGSQPSMVELEKLREKPRERLEKMKEEYRSLNTWIEKSDYLRSLINPKMTFKEAEDSNLEETSESQHSAPMEDGKPTTAQVTPPIRSEVFPNELENFEEIYGGNEGHVIPALKPFNQEYPDPALYISGESTPIDESLPPIHSLQIIEEDEMPRSQRLPEPEDRLWEERKNKVFPMEEHLIPKTSSILKPSSSLQEAKSKKGKTPYFSDLLTTSDSPLGQENTNQKGRPSINLRKSWERHPTDTVGNIRKVAFAQKDYTIPVFREDSTEFKPKHRKLSKSGLDPFLRNINTKMSFRKKKDQDLYRYPSTLSTEFFEHEDQDPPYSHHLRSSESNTSRAGDPNLITIQMANKNNFTPDPTITTMIADRKNRLSHDSTVNGTNISITNIFTSNNPIITLTKFSESDKLSTYPSSNATKPSETKLPSDPSISKLTQDNSSNATLSSSTKRLSHDSSNSAIKSSDTENKLSRDSSITARKSSDIESKVSSIISARKSSDIESKVSSIISARKSSDIESKLSSLISARKSSDTENKLSHDSIVSAKKSSDTENKLSRDSSIIARKSSDTENKQSRDSIVSAKKSSDVENKLSHDSIVSAKKSSDVENKQSRDSIVSARKSSDVENKLSHDSIVSARKSSDVENKLSRESIISARKSLDIENKLSQDTIISSRKSSDIERVLSSIVSATKSPDTENKLSRESIISAIKSSDIENKLSQDTIISARKSSDIEKVLSSIVSAIKSSDTENKLSRDSIIGARKSSDIESKLSSIIISPRKSSDTENKLSHDSITSARTSSDTENKLSSIIISPRKSSDTENKLSRDSIASARKSSDTENKLSRDSSSISARKSSDIGKILSSIISAIKSSDTENKLSHDSIISAIKSLDIENKLSQDTIISAMKSSDLEKVSSIISSRKSSDTENKLSRDSSISARKSSDTEKILSSIISVIKSSDTENKLSHDSIIGAIKSLGIENKLSQDIISARKSSDLEKVLSSIISSRKSSDTETKLSRDSSIIARKSSDTENKVPCDSIISARKSSDTNKLSHDPGIISPKSSDSKNKLPSGEPTVNSDTSTNTAKASGSNNKLAASQPDSLTVDSSDMQRKLEEQLPSTSLSSCRREPSMTGNVNIHHHSSSSINFTSDIENLKQSIVLKSILSKNLQDLSDELFSKLEVSASTEAMQRSCSPCPSVRHTPSGGTEDKVFGKIQDISSWLSSKDILNSQALLSSVIKSTQDILLEGEPEKSSAIQEDVSEKHLEAAEMNFPMNRKSSFKTKHLVSEVSGSKQDLNGSAYDYVIKQIFTAPMFSRLEMGMTALSEAETALQKQSLTPWEGSVSSQILNHEEKGNEVHLSQSKSILSQIIQSFPVDTLLESGIIKVVELDKEHQSSWLDTQTASPKEELQNLTEQHSVVKSQTNSTNPPYSSVSGVEYTEDSQNMSTQESKYLTPDEKTDLPNERFEAEDTELGSTLENLSNSLGKLKDTDIGMLKSFLKSIFNAFFKYQSERRQQSEKELEGVIQHAPSSGTEHLEKIQENFNKADKVNRKPILNPKLRVFLEKLSESEVKNLKSELSKHIQQYLVERLSESGHITKEDLPKIYKNLYRMTEKTELKEQSSFQEKYSETVKEIMSFVNNFNHHFIDKHLEIKLRSFLSEILQNYFLKNLSVSNLFSETDAAALHPSMSSLRRKSASMSFQELGQDVAGGSFGPRLKINMKYPVSNYLKVLSENELLSLKDDLRKYLQVLFLDKLYKSGLMTEKQLKGINQQINSFHSPPERLKYIKTNLRDESSFMREDLEDQKKYSKMGQNTILQTFLEERVETQMTRKEEKGSSFSCSLKENSPTIWEKKNVYSREVKTLNLIKVAPPPNQNIQGIPLNRSAERPVDILLKKHKKEHGFMQLSQAENSVYKTEITDPYSWDGKSKTIQSKTCFEKALKMKPLDKRENNGILKLTTQEKPDTGFSPYLKFPTCKMARESESYLSRLSFPTWQTDGFIHANPDNGEQSKLDQYCQRLKGNNNNNKKHLVTFAQFKNEMDTFYVNPYESCNEKCPKISESQPFKYKENVKNSRPSFFPEVLKRENMKFKRKERDHTAKPKKSFHKIARILPATLPTTRPHLRKSVPRTLLHWTARRTIHDCLDRFDDLHVPSVKHPKISKSRTRLLGKSSDDSHNQAKHCARPYTAPEPNKRRETAAGKFASPRMVSAGLVHIHDTIAENEIRKMRSRKRLKDIEKRPLICDIIQMLDIEE